MRRAPTVRLHWRERRDLAGLVQSPTAPRKLRVRAAVVLRAAEGASNHRIAAELGTDSGTVGRWRRRFLLHGVAGILKDAPRSGRPPLIPESKVEQVVHTALDHRSLESPWPSTRILARRIGVSKSTVQRIWKARGIRPGGGLPSAGPREGMGFLGRVTDMVGLYLNPPERAIAFSTDERAHAPRLRGRELRSIEEFRRRSEGVEFRAFLAVLDRETPGPLEVHLLADSRLAPPPVPVDRWLAEHPRFHVHYLPSDRVGLTLIDRLVAEFSRRKVRPEESPSAQRLRHAVREHFRESPAAARPFVWTATAEDVQRVRRWPEIKY